MAPDTIAAVSPVETFAAAYLAAVEAVERGDVTRWEAERLRAIPAEASGARERRAAVLVEARAPGLTGWAVADLVARQDA